ncbi:MAG: CopD family protein [Pseudomonadota bacterium]|nr:CopD family protein [Pseudomonadota bacterium]
MSITPSWEFLSVLSKVFIYLGAASALGGAFCLLNYNDNRSATLRQVLSLHLAGALLGLQAVAAAFLAQVGTASGSGLSGAFDRDMAGLLLSTQLGDLSLFRAVGFAILIGSGLFFYQTMVQQTRAPRRLFYQRLFAVNAFGFIFLLLSFRFGGHVSVQSLSVQFALAVHFTMFALWIGALYPFLTISRTEQVAELKVSLERFSKHAVVIVSLLLLSGLALMLSLIHSVADLFTTAYGIALILKILLVIGLVAIAAVNKYIIVPRLLLQTDTAQFQRSVRLEIVVAILLLLLTAYLSTVLGPTMH